MGLTVALDDATARVMGLGCVVVCKTCLNGDHTIPDRFSILFTSDDTRRHLEQHADNGDTVDDKAWEVYRRQREREVVKALEVK